MQRGKGGDADNSAGGTSFRRWIRIRTVATFWFRRVIDGGRLVAFARSLSLPLPVPPHSPFNIRIMDPSSVGSNGVKKLEDTESPDSKRDVKVKTLNRVPRKSLLILCSVSSPSFPVLLRCLREFHAYCNFYGRR